MTTKLNVTKIKEALTAGDLTIKEIAAKVAELTGQPIKKYKDKATATKRLAAAIVEFDSAPKKSRKPAGDTVSAVARALILAGKTNQEVWIALQKQFNLDDGKRSYPGWYRSEVKRKGLLAA
jgi:hypothetical protein